MIKAIKVLLTWVPGAVPHAVVEAIIDMVEARYLHDFFAVHGPWLCLWEITRVFGRTTWYRLLVRSSV